MRPDLPQEHKPNNAFAILKDRLPSQPSKQAVIEKAKQIRQYEFVEPVFVAKLANFYGTANEAARKLGLSNTVISEGIRTNKTRKVTELAARAIYELECVPAPVAHIDTRGRVLVSMLIEREAYEALKPWLDDAGATHKTLI